MAQRDRCPQRSTRGWQVAVSDDIRPLKTVPEFERQPPQDLAAEQSVLGGMLLSKDAIADVVEVLRSVDFYRPAHQLVYDVVLDLYGRGEPADPVTVAAELGKRGEITRAGGAPYLHTLISSVPTAANAGYYARIVAEQAILRRLVEAGTRIVQLGYGSASGGLDVDDVVDRAQQAVYDVTERRTSEDYVVLEQLLQGTLDEIESIGNRGGGMIGVPTGFADLDALLNGLHPGQLIVVAARPGVGKALALDTPLATPTGWTTMGDVEVGDLLLGADGRPTRVVAATEVLHDRPCFALSFCDGDVIVADAQHQWQTTPRRNQRSNRFRAPGGGGAPHPGVVTTRQIAASGARRSHAVALSRPLDLPAAALPMAPYVLGAWLGAGHPGGARISTADPELVVHLESHGVDVVPQPGRASRALSFAAGGASLLPVLRNLGVLGRKHIPPVYLRGSHGQRRDLLAGLLDAVATVTHNGSVQIAATNQSLADDVRELLHSLGHRSRQSPRRSGGRGSATSVAVTFATCDEVFRVEGKRLAHKQRSVGTSAARQRAITDVRVVPSVPVRCVEVDNAEHLYLAGRSMIPTHNSTLGLDFARSCSIKHGMTSCIFSLEMSKSEITMRLLSAEAKVPLHHMRSGTMSDDDWARMARRMGEVADAPLFIDDSPNMTMMEIRAKARRLKQRHELRLIIVDYLQLMTSPKRVESRQQEVSELSRGLKLLAKELEVPVVAMSQLNRGPEQRTDKRPQLADLRECLTGDTRITRADTGEQVPIADLVGLRDVPVWSVDEHLRLCRSVMSEVWPTGVRTVRRLILASGRRVEATDNHPFLTVGGWTPVDALSPDDCLAVTADEPAGRIPADAWDHVRKAMLPYGIKTQALAERLGISHFGSVVHGGGISRARMARIAHLVPDPYLHTLASADIDWERIVSIDTVAEQREVYDACVPGTHSFLANGVVSHNSGAIEQDSDVVVMLYREDMFEKESPRAGEADLNVAKHRNGPTGSITVAFQGHYSRFMDFTTGP
ncbi:MAG: replicative DNA helicase [Pseudonocardiales bacterium]